MVPKIAYHKEDIRNDSDHSQISQCLSKYGKRILYLSRKRTEYFQIPPYFVSLFIVSCNLSIYVYLFLYLRIILQYTVFMFVCVCVCTFCEVS